MPRLRRVTDDPHRDPYTGEQLRFYRWLPPHMRPSMFEEQRSRGPRITVEAVLIAAVLMAMPVGWLLGYFGVFR